MKNQQHQFVADEPTSTARKMRCVAHEQFRVWVRGTPDRVWVCPFGELDLATAPILDQYLWDAQAGRVSVVLDLRAVTFIDCIALRSVFAARLRAVLREDLFQVLCGPGQVARVLSVSGLEPFLNVIQAATPAGVEAQPAMRAAA